MNTTRSNTCFFGLKIKITINFYFNCKNQNQKKKENKIKTLIQANQNEMKNETTKNEKLKHNYMNRQDLWYLSNV